MLCSIGTDRLLVSGGGSARLDMPQSVGDLVDASAESDVDASAESDGDASAEPDGDNSSCLARN